ncbi:hypothetical protein HME01_23430 [Vreelandella aquamarina]|uniref:Major facilitator superfamily (MFS) profile domain-containing protein n=2 Tax=Vreelandella aquamarina TaxID=77097 RepID=A0A1N6DP70_9GAMM|nr:hypothetical protein HME01_23430 [Halomonas meridiana]SIN63839.1 hypothetical protein SAMN05878249_1500 [Halomonas meridiana]SIN72611.1 hypothetical protein SAMN05878438_2935 [Halomonas meridiana]SIO41798.1 hypothetical protein SAMN05878442_3107 [Halomonas meridiana]
MHLGRHESVANVWSSRLLAGVAVLAVVHLLSGVTWAESLAQLMLTGFLMLGWPRFSFMARMLALACVVASFFALWRLPSPWAVLHEAAGGFVFLAAFMTALAVLRLPAYRSKLIRRCGHSLLLQPPTWRYPILSLGSTLFGIVLNFGVLNLFMSMIDKSNTLGSAQGRVWLQEVRRRRMLLATLRGFTLAPLVSPLGIGVAVVLANLETLTWGELFPYVLLSAIILFLLGWACDHVAGPPPRARVALVARPSLMPLAAFSLMLLALVMLVFALATVLSLRLPQAVVIGVPLGAWIWLAWQCRGISYAGVGPATVMLARRLPEVLGGIGNEVVALGSGAYLGYLSVALLDPAQLGGVAFLLVALGNWLPAVVLMLIVILAQVGVNPIISVTFLTSMVAQVGLENVSLPLLAAAMLSGWSLTMVSSPFTAAMMIMSRFTGMTAGQIGLRWNGAFLATSLMMAAVLFRLAS